MKKLLSFFLSISIILSCIAAGIPAAYALEEVATDAGYDYALSTDAISDADERTEAKLRYSKYGFAYENFGNKIYENQVKSHESCAISGSMSDGYTKFNAKDGAAGVGWDGGWTITKQPGNSAAYVNWILDYSTFWNGDTVKTMDKRSCARYNGITMQRKLLNPVDLSVDGDYFIMCHSAVGKKVTDTVKDMGGMWFELLNDIGSAEVTFGANVPEGSATYMTPFVSGSGYDNRTSGDSKVTYSQWYVLLVHIESSADGSDKLKFIIYPESDPDAVEVITTEVESNEILDTFAFKNPSNSYMLIEDVGIDCFNESIEASPFTPGEVNDAILNSRSVEEASKVYNLLPKTATKEYYRLTYKDILDNAYDSIALTEESEEDARNSFVFLGNFQNDYDVISKAEELKALCELNGWDCATAKIVSATPENESIVYEDAVETVEITYDYLLDESGSVTLMQGANSIDAQCIVEGNTVTLNITGEVLKGVTCVLSTEGLTDYKGDSVPGITFSISMLPVLNIQDGGEYTEGSKVLWDTPEIGTCTVVLTDENGNEETIESPHTLSKAGTYTLVMTGEVEGGKTEERIVEFTVNKAVKPEAKEVTINVEDGNKLKGDYDWYSANGNENEKNSEYIWYRSKTSLRDGEYEVAGDELNYTLSSDDENRWLVFAVIPGSDSPLEPTGKETKSKPFAAPFNPVVNSLGINGDFIKDALLESDYQYYDENGDAENKEKTVVKWYLAKDEKAEGTDITSKLDDEKKMKITEDMFEQYLYITVQPVSTVAPVEGGIYTSKRYLMPKAPVISDVEIEGKAKVGNTLKVDYKYYDANGDVEGDTVIEWKNVDTGKVLGTGRSLLLKSSMKGDVIHVSVKGVSQKAPFESLQIVYSDGIEVKAAESSGGGGGGKSISTSQSYPGSSSGSVVTTPQTPAAPVVPDKPQIKEGFTDISGHWAEQNILSLEKAGVISSAEKYRPDDSVSRAELVILVIRAKGIEIESYKDSFADVNSADWYADYVETALKAGIIAKADSFRPLDSVTREETAKILADVNGLSSDTVADFKDMDMVSPWALKYVNAVYAHGIFLGDTNKCFNPLSQLSRAEAAAIIDRLIN